MTSSFTYGDSDFIAAMTTPYGTTTFRHEAKFADRRIEATDPAGGTERIEYTVQHPGLPATIPSSDVPTGFSSFNTIMDKYVVLYWDKLAYAAGPTLSNATITNLVVAPTPIRGRAIFRTASNGRSKAAPGTSTPAWGRATAPASIRGQSRFRACSKVAGRRSPR